MDKGERDLSRKRIIVPAAAEDGLIRIESPIASSLLGSRFWRIFDWARGGIGLRLVAAVLLFSSIVTLTLTALQLYLDYDREVRSIETRLPSTDVKLRPDWSLQDPHDWVEVLKTAVPEALEASGVDPAATAVSSSRSLWTPSALRARRWPLTVRRTTPYTQLRRDSGRWTV